MSARHRGFGAITWPLRDARLRVPWTSSCLASASWPECSTIHRRLQGRLGGGLSRCVRRVQTSSFGVRRTPPHASRRDVRGRGGCDLARAAAAHVPGALQRCGPQAVVAKRRRWSVCRFLGTPACVWPDSAADDFRKRERDERITPGTQRRWRRSDSSRISGKSNGAKMSTGQR